MSGWLSKYDDANHYQKQSGYSASAAVQWQVPGIIDRAKRIIFRNRFFFSWKSLVSSFFKPKLIAISCVQKSHWMALCGTTLVRNPSFHRAPNTLMRAS
jgi:hypothetical protein